MCEFSFPLIFLFFFYSNFLQCPAPNDASSCHSVSVCPLICHRQSISDPQYQSLSVSLCQSVCVNHSLQQYVSGNLPLSLLVSVYSFSLSMSLSLCPCHSIPSALSLPIFLFTLLGLVYGSPYLKLAMKLNYRFLLQLDIWVSGSKASMTIGNPS